MTDEPFYKASIDEITLETEENMGEITIKQLDDNRLKAHVRTKTGNKHEISVLNEATGDTDDVINALRNVMEKADRRLQKSNEKWRNRDKLYTKGFYYDLLRMKHESGIGFHIPVPMLFRKTGPYVLNKLVLIASQNEVDKRDSNYYKCPGCHRTSFFQGICDSCEWKQIMKQEDDPQIDEEYFEVQDSKEDLKESFFTNIHNSLSVETALEQAGIEEIAYVESTRSKR